MAGLVAGRLWLFRNAEARVLTEASATNRRCSATDSATRPASGRWRRETERPWRDALCPWLHVSQTDRDPYVRRVQRRVA
jgi:hypothetical protein